MVYSSSNPFSFNDMRPLYSEADKGLRKLLRQYQDGKHRGAISFTAKFTATRKHVITITYYSDYRKSNSKKIFSEEYEFPYKAVMKSNNGKPRALSNKIRINSHEINLDEQVRTLNL